MAKENIIKSSELNEDAELVAPQRDFAADRSGLLSGHLSPRDLLESCIARIEAAEPRVQAFCALDLAAARRAADAATERYAAGRPASAIDGMVLGVKDLIDTVDHPTRMNSPLFDAYAAPADAACVAALKAAGATILGKTVTTEFGMGRSGPTRNPHDLARTPGGSSSGAAASVAAGMAHAGLGTQTQGSILRPASYCGVVGYKPSHGRLPVTGIHPAAPGMDHLGVLSTSVADCWLVAQTIAGASADLPAPRLPRRIGLLGYDAIEPVEPAVAAALQAVASRLAAAGVAVSDAASDPELAAASAALGEAPEIALDIVGAEMVPHYWPMLDRAGDRVSARIHDLVAHGMAVGDAGLASARARRVGLRQRIATLFGRFDLLLLPSAPGPAPLGHDFTGSRRLQVPWTLIGFPALGLPAAGTGALPIGLQLLGGPEGDAALVAMASAVTDTFAAG